MNVEFVSVYGKDIWIITNHSNPVYKQFVIAANGTCEIRSSHPASQGIYIIAYDSGSLALLTINGRRSQYVSASIKPVNHVFYIPFGPRTTAVAPKTTQASCGAPEVTQAPTDAPETTEAPTDAPETTQASTDAPETTQAPTDAPETTQAFTDGIETTQAPADTATEPPSPYTETELNISPPDGTRLTFLPGSTAKLRWTYKCSTLCSGRYPFLRTWYFTSNDGGWVEVLAGIFRDEEPVIYNSSLPEVAVEKPATLILKNVDLRYNGTYQFRLLGLFFSEAKILVFIAVRPTVTVNCSSFITVNEEDDITCVCRGKGGNPPANVTWYKDGVQLGETKKEEQTLIRRNTSVADNGMYTCVAQSHIDMTDKKSIKVTINCKTELEHSGIVNEERHQALEVWHIVVSLVSGIIFGILAAYIAWFCHRRWFTKRKCKQSPDPQPTEAETTYEELDLSKMNTEDNYQSLKGDVSIKNQNLVAK